MIKIIADKQLKIYELTYLLPADYTDAQLSTVHEVISKLVDKYKGKILETQDWGKKTLAYKVKSKGKLHSEAVYTHQLVKFLPAQVQAFEREVLLEEEVMRHLLVVADNQSEPTVATEEKKK